MDNSTKFEPEQVEIRIFGQSGDEHSVSVDILTGILQGLQRAVYAIAKDEEQAHLTSSNLPKEFKQRYLIRCKIPQSGSYALPIEFGVDDQRFPVCSTCEFVNSVGDKLQACFRALSEETPAVFNTIKTPLLRKQVLNAFRSILPKAGAKWQLGISGSRFSQELQYTGKAGKVLKRFVDHHFSQENVTLQTVTGYLVAMDFDKRLIVLKYPSTETELECYYNDELEVELFENRRELLQVTGNVTYCENDRETPKKIAAVDDIQFLDLSDFTLDSFVAHGKELNFHESLVLTPGLTESCQFMTLRDEKLGIDVIAQTREELYEELLGELQMLWTTCAMQDDDKLGEEFLEQKKHLLAAIKEVQ